MKGIVMNLLGEMVEDQLGLQFWNEILESTGFDGVYTAAGMYDDAELLTLVGEISAKSGIPAEQLVFAFGEFMFPSFVKRYPELVDPNATLLSFLETIDNVIHVEVKKIYPDAATPGFSHTRISDNCLELRYQSDRQMCTLAEGLVSGAARFFTTEYALIHDPCLKEGASHCGLTITIK